ncbi:LysE family translocator [Fredinandcohnia onubensis]|uniref:LysE family translocator n=1 Tax=Fredinandcohnia onubensis TaxID=1571209 RepID=UPI000C0BF82D|nr:LysE family translocator [Fredinandcohnia onubensis]
MDFLSVLPFLSAAIILTLMPGPDNLFTLAQSLAKGKNAGAAYLLFLAYKSFKEKDSDFNLKNEDNLDYKSLYKKGVIMNLLNPKVSLFFLAFFPQFINYENGHVSIQMLVYGMLFLIQTLVIFSLISIFAGKVGSFLRKNPTISKKINVIQGSLFTLIGLKIVFSEK